MPGEAAANTVREAARLNARSWELSQSNPRGALRLAEQALRIVHPESGSPELAAAHLNAGWALINLGRNEDAVGHLGDARDRYGQLSDRDGVMKATNALAVLSFRIGDTAQAQTLWEEALCLAERAGNRERRVAALNNLGELFCSLGEYERSAEYYLEANRLAEELDDPAVTAVILVNLGRIQLEQGSPESAEGQLREALELASGADDRITEAEALTQLGRAVAAAGGEMEDAEQLHMSSIELCEEIGHPVGVITALYALAELLVGADRLEEAEEHLRRAVEIVGEIDAPVPAVSLIETLSERYEARGELVRSLDLLRWLLKVQRERAGAQTARRLRTMRAQHELDHARMEAEIARIRSEDLRAQSEALELSNEKLQLMHRIGSELTSSLDLEEVAGRLHDRLSEHMTVDVFAIACYRPEKRLLDFAVVIEDTERIAPFTVPVDSADSFASWVVRNRREICMNDAEREDHFYVETRRPFTGKRSNSMVFLPLELEGRIIGVLTVQSQRANQYDEQRVDLLRLLSPYVAVALDNSSKLQTIRTLNHELEREKRQLEEAYERIAHMANHDLLTGLPNRRLLGELVRDYLPLARRRADVFGLLYVDLDDFKPINDTCGHEAGDRVLVQVAERLRSVVRESDTVARIGGDEFVIVLRQVRGQDDAIAIGEKVLDAIREPTEIDDHRYRLSASVGVSIFPEHGDSFEALLNAADRAMYRVKLSRKSGVAAAR